MPGGRGPGTGMNRRDGGKQATGFPQNSAHSFSTASSSFTSDSLNIRVDAPDLRRHEVPGRNARKARVQQGESDTELEQTAVQPPAAAAGGFRRRPLRTGEAGSAVVRRLSSRLRNPARRRFLRSSLTSAAGPFSASGRRDRRLAGLCAGRDADVLRRALGPGSAAGERLPLAAHSRSRPVEFQSAAS